VILRSAARWRKFRIKKENRRVIVPVYHGLFRLPISLPCVACFGSRAGRALAPCLLACRLLLVTSNDAWRSLRGVPRALGRSLVTRVACRFTSRGRGVSDYMMGRGTGLPGLPRVALAFPPAPGVRNARVTFDEQAKPSKAHQRSKPAPAPRSRSKHEDRRRTTKTPRTRAAKRQQVRAHERVRGHAGRLPNAKPARAGHEGRVREMTHRAKARKLLVARTCKNVQAVPIPYPPGRRGQGTIAISLHGRCEKT
jgi:hypothetical protein